MIKVIKSLFINKEIYNNKPFLKKLKQQQVVELKQIDLRIMKKDIINFFFLKKRIHNSKNYLFKT